MNYAIAEIAGRQFKLEEGATIDLPRLQAEEGESLTLDKLLLSHWDGAVKVGGPYIDGASAEVEVVGHPRGKKIRVFRKKRRKGFKKARGAREEFTRVTVKQVTVPA